MSDKSNEVEFFSPAEFQAKAVELELGGKKPETNLEWQLCVNFWAWNAMDGTEVALCSLFKTILDCPLSENTVCLIAEQVAQAKRKQKVMKLLLASRN